MKNILLAAVAIAALGAAGKIAGHGMDYTALNAARYAAQHPAPAYVAPTAPQQTESLADIHEDENGSWLMFDLDDNIIGRFATRADCEQGLQVSIDLATAAYENALSEDAPQNLQPNQTPSQGIAGDQYVAKQEMVALRESYCTE